MALPTSPPFKTTQQICGACAAWAAGLRHVNHNCGACAPKIHAHLVETVHTLTCQRKSGRHLPCQAGRCNGGAGIFFAWQRVRVRPPPPSPPAGVLTRLRLERNHHLGSGSATEKDRAGFFVFGACVCSCVHTDRCMVVSVHGGVGEHLLVDVGSLLVHPFLA